MKEKLIEKKVDSFMKRTELELKKLGLGCKPVINFPNRKKVPFISKIAMFIIKKQGGMLDTNFFPRKK